MDYPNNFDNPVFPTMRRLALSRILSVWTLVAFFIAVVLCGFLIWSYSSIRAVPYMISIDDSSIEWSAISEKTKHREVPSYQVMQEYVVGNFARKWFAISGDKTENDSKWCRCSAEICNNYDINSDNKSKCDICCGSSPVLYATFVSDVLPDYTARSLNGETWVLDINSITITPESNVTESGGNWHLRAVLNSSISGSIKIEAYADIQKSGRDYPLTFGYYVADFNAYKVTEK